MINPSSLAFDIDGVLADTMTLFLSIARDEYLIDGIKYEDITCYMLEDCLDIDTKIIEAIITQILDGNHKEILNPIEGAPEVLTKIEKNCGNILFVTARPYMGAIHDWISNILPIDSASIEIIATGSFESKAETLLKRNVSHFVDDRLETCFHLNDAGITPVLFKQPWNRKNHPFVEVSNWNELESLIEFDGEKL